MEPGLHGLESDAVTCPKVATSGQFQECGAPPADGLGTAQRGAGSLSGDPGEFDTDA